MVIHDSQVNQGWLVVTMLATIGYVCYVTGWALFEMKISKSMELVSDRVTWPIPMSINARILHLFLHHLYFFTWGGYMKIELLEAILKIQ